MQNLLTKAEALTDRLRELTDQAQDLLTEIYAEKIDDSIDVKALV